MHMCDILLDTERASAIIPHYPVMDQISQGVRSCSEVTNVIGLTNPTSHLLSNRVSSVCSITPLEVFEWGPQASG